MKTNIYFIIPSMHGGGSERVVSHLVKHLNSQRFDITLVLVKKEGVFLNEIPPHVNVIDLGLSRTRYAPIKIISLIWKKRPDIVFSTLGHLNLVIASFRFALPRSTKFIARESSTVSVHNKNEIYPALFDFLFRTVYRTFDKIVCQSRYMQSDLVTNYNVPEEKTVVINNPVDNAYIIQSSSAQNSVFNNQKINFVAVGRLSREKGFDRLIDAFGFIKNSNIHLSIIGEGIDKEMLQSKVREKSLERQVSFLGFQRNPYPYMREAKALIQTSHYEGFPNVVIEANACGTPVIAFRSPGGISEIMDSTVCGWLIKDGDIQALALKIEQVAYLPFNSNEVEEYTINRYSLNSIIPKYEQLFESILRTGPAT